MIVSKKICKTGKRANKGFIRKFDQFVSRYLCASTCLDGTSFVVGEYGGGAEGKKRNFGSSEKCDQNSVRKCVEVCI